MGRTIGPVTGSKLIQEGSDVGLAGVIKGGEQVRTSVGLGIIQSLRHDQGLDALAWL